MADRTGTGQALGTLLIPRSECIVLAYNSNGSLSIAAGRVVQISGVAQIVQVAATITRGLNPPLGIAMNAAPSTAVTRVEVCLHGEIVGEAGGAITVGDWVIPDSDGQIIAGSLGLAAGAVAVTSDADDPTAEGYTGIGICTRQDGTAAAGDGIGVYVK